jgi:Rod binding domain-containing protein
MIAGLSDIDFVAADASPESRKAAFNRVVESFEAVFISQLIRGLRESFSKEFWGGSGFGKGIYASWFDQALSEAVARAGGVGVKDQLQRWVFPAEGETSPNLADPEEGEGHRFQGRF